MRLGLDSSTSTTGWAFCNGTEIVSAGFIDTSKLETNKNKIDHIASVIESLPDFKNITSINLEAALSGFMGGMTSQQTIIKLARFNALLEYILSEKWKLPVNLVSVTTARKQVFGKSRVKGIKPKDYVKQQLSSRMDLTKFDKLNKIKSWDVHNSDMYDAMVMSLFSV